MKTNHNDTINGVSIYELSHTGLVMGAIARLSTGEGEELNQLAAQPTPFPQVAKDALSAISDGARGEEWDKLAGAISCRIEEAMIEKAKELDALCMTYQKLECALHSNHV
jgi:hypothetical protein